MALFAVIYVALLGQKGILLLMDTNWVAKVMGLAILVLPLVALWAIFIELRFGIRAEQLAKSITLPELELVLRPSGRATKESAQEQFLIAKEHASQNLTSWEAWFRLGEAYEASGDRKLARKAIRKAIQLANSPKTL